MDVLAPVSIIVGRSLRRAGGAHPGASFQKQPLKNPMPKKSNSTAKPVAASTKSEPRATAANAAPAVPSAPLKLAAKRKAAAALATVVAPAQAIPAPQVPVTRASGKRGPRTPVATAAELPRATKAAAGVPVKPGVAPKLPAYTHEDVALRAYFIAQRRQAENLPGDPHQDWIEAERQLALPTVSGRKKR